jgi:hypothetical protein
MINEQLPAFHSTAIPWYTAAKADSSAHRRLDAGCIKRQEITHEGGES